MALRDIRRQGDEVLAKKSRPVTEFNERLHTLLDDMRETLIHAGGAGLAAPQVGVLRRVAVVADFSREAPPEEQIIELVNPEILEREGQQEGNEGCLSIPGVVAVVKRPMKVRVRALDREGKPFEVMGEGMTARAFCHEIDHLDGHLFLEFADRILTEEEVAELYREETADGKNDSKDR